MRKVKCEMKSAEWCVECGKLVIKAFYIAYFFLRLLVGELGPPNLPRFSPMANGTVF